MAGPALSDDLGGYDGDVPLDALERHRWIYESPFYRKLIEKANLIDPTPLTSRGESIEIQHTCRNRALVSCQLLHTYFAPNLDERTNGQVRFYITSFNELGLNGPDTLQLVRDGTLASAVIYGPYLALPHNARGMPAIGIQNLWGIYSSRE